MKKRTIFIGDIHGCYDELKLLIKRLNIKEKDNVYFVGDYINKGPKSFKVVKFLYRNREQFKGVLGNHDYYFFEKLKNDIKLNKDEKKLYKKLKENPKIFKYYRELPLYIEENDFLLIHGGLNPEKTIENHTAQEITNIRVFKGKPWYDYYKGDKKIFYGHWAMQGVHIGKKVIGLDSGCCYGGFLSAYVLETGELIQQGSLDQYAKIDYSHVNPVFQ
ncbi:metallophosphoesterase [Candidatus Gracilibacteria bacterium]|nr:metallophosphoesterase [Candidatus Gracilibacteria bacterium]